MHYLFVIPNVHVHIKRIEIQKVVNATLTLPHLIVTTYTE